MSTIEAALTVVAVLVVSLAGAYRLIDRAQRRVSSRGRIVREAHQRAEQARVLDPVTLAATDPAWEAGRERMWDAIHDNNHNQAKGDTNS